MKHEQNVVKILYEREASNQLHMSKYLWNLW